MEECEGLVLGAVAPRVPAALDALYFLQRNDLGQKERVHAFSLYHARICALPVQGKLRAWTRNQRVALHHLTTLFAHIDT